MLITAQLLELDISGHQVLGLGRDRGSQHQIVLRVRSYPLHLDSDEREDGLLSEQGEVLSYLRRGEALAKIQAIGRPRQLGENVL